MYEDISPRSSKKQVITESEDVGVSHDQAKNKYLGSHDQAKNKHLKLLLLLRCKRSLLSIDYTHESFVRNTARATMYRILNI